MTAGVDVLISGAGPVGASLVLALKQQGLQCRLLDAAPAPVQGDDRSLGLTSGTQRLLQQLGVWQHITQAEPIRALHISERGRFGHCHIQAADHGLESMGATVPAQQLHDALHKALAAQGIEVLREQKVVSTEMHCAEQRAVTLASGECVHARLLVGADGVKSSVRADLGIEVQLEDYGQVALVSQFDAQRDPQGCAYERFAADGPLAVLPRGGQRVGSIWMVSTAQAAVLMNLDDEAYAQAFQQAFGWRLGRLRSAAPRLQWPLRRLRAQALSAPRAVLLGNAATAFHPLAAQGFNLALRDVEALRLALQGASDPGAPELLRRWEQSRRADHDRVERMTDGLVKVFTQRLPVLSQLRALGLAAMGLLEPAQARMVHDSAGVAEAQV
nr:FAD-dependent monooxygenase [Oceanococcus sp. HetDA_MAG_MS8]